MGNTLQFVSDIASSPTVRLDLNVVTGTNEWYLDRNPDFSTPSLKRSIVSTLLRDGEAVPASAYENRILGIDLTLKCADEDDASVQIQKLNRELDRPINILKWQSGNASFPVFFRCLRSPDYRLQVDPVTSLYHFSLNILAEPFAYGLEEDGGGPFTVENDPEDAAANKLWFDIAAADALGDVATPLFIQVDPTTTITGILNTAVSVRQRGSPGGFYHLPGEDMTLGTDVTLPGNDALMAGAGSNYARCSFTTSQTLQTRLTEFFPAAASSSVEYRGTYRIFARLRRNDSSSVIRVQARLGVNGATEISTLPLTTFIFWWDMGLLSLPTDISDPIYEGYLLTEQPANGALLTFLAARDSGSGSLDIDSVYAMAADATFGAFKHLAGSTIELILDGPLDMAYTRINSGTNPVGGTDTLGMIPIEQVGDIPHLVPNQDNRIGLILNAYHSAIQTDVKTWQTTVTIKYWPRFLYIRP